MGGRALSGRRISREEAQQIAEEIINGIDDKCNIRKYLNASEICGSYRRGKEEVGDVDLVILPNMFHLLTVNMSLEMRFGVAWQHKRKSFLYKNVQVEINICENREYYGAMLLYATGSGDFNIKMRVKAKVNGMLLNQYGLWRGQECIAGREEKDIFEALKMDWVAPEDRNVSIH